MTICYSLEEIEQICYEGPHYVVPDTILTIIHNLAKQVGSPDYIKTPVFKKRTYEERSGTDRGHERGDRSNEKERVGVNERGDRDRGNKYEKYDKKPMVPQVRPFKSSESTPSVNTIRTHINKLTDKNYADLRDKIVADIEAMLSTSLQETNKRKEETNERKEENQETNERKEENQESKEENQETHERNQEKQANIQKIQTSISAALFDIASANRYYSALYATLYSELSKRYPFMAAECASHFARFTQGFEMFAYVDPEKDYGAFCDMNKKNEHRKSLATFYKNLAQLGCISSEAIDTMVHKLLTTLTEYLLLDHKKNEVDELTEMIVLLYSPPNASISSTQSTQTLTDEIATYIATLAKSKVANYKSLTNKCVFKFMDLVG